jgi:uncharacterized membrane protein YeaQ/YmgE (transglycosylase-associated protein family)
MLSLLFWMLIGGLTGWLTGLVVHSRLRGYIGDILVGMMGAFLGGVVLSLLLPGEYTFPDFNLGSLLMALLGAMILLLVVRAVGWGTRERRP